MTKLTAICLVIFATATIISGCATTLAHTDFVPPGRPFFANYDHTVWTLAAEECREDDSAACKFVREAQTNIAADDLACKRYIRSTEERSEIHNERNQE